MSSYMCPPRLRWPSHWLSSQPVDPDVGRGYTPEQVTQRALEAHMNGGRHGDPREPLAEFIVNELRLHGFLK